MICLSNDDLQVLTMKKRFTSQKRVLQKMKIPYRVRPDGSPVVFRSDLESSKFSRSEVQLNLELPSA